jgi:zinc and cadmium transporter
VVALDWLPSINQYILSVSAASFLYIAMSDLIPDLHRGQIDANGVRQVLLIAAGIFTIVGFERVLG